MNSTISLQLSLEICASHRRKLLVATDVMKRG